MGKTFSSCYRTQPSQRNVQAPVPVAPRATGYTSYHASYSYTQPRVQQQVTIPRKPVAPPAPRIPTAARVSTVPSAPQTPTVPTVSRASTVSVLPSNHGSRSTPGWVPSALEIPRNTPKPVRTTRITQPTSIKQEKPLRKVECPKCNCSWPAQEWVRERETACEKCGFEFKLYPLNKEYPKGKGLTPYQGPDRQEGEFRCSECNKYWKSVNSWADMGQDCMTCEILVMPYTQKPSPEFGSARSNPHPKELCEKCKKLGYYCGKKDLKKYIQSKGDIQSQIYYSSSQNHSQQDSLDFYLSYD